MWNLATEDLKRTGGQRVTVRRDGAPASWGDVIRAWRQDEAFRSAFTRTLADAPFKAYKWETPPVTAGTLDRPFEFVLLDAPALDRPPDATAFADQFRGGGDGELVASFPNLGGDAVLVVPRPAGSLSAYAHLAAFLRSAPERQAHELWRVLGAATEARLGTEPLWVSTAGMGVPWLHVRLDSRPKYYGFRPYAVGSGAGA